MPQSEMHRRRQRHAEEEYSYRRTLGLSELLPAIGIGIGAGLFAYYVTRLMMQRTPLRVPGRELARTKRDRHPAA